jgi:hypothetical protein
MHGWRWKILKGATSEQVKMQGKKQFCMVMWMKEIKVNTKLTQVVSNNVTWGNTLEIPLCYIFGNNIVDVKSGFLSFTFWNTLG